LNPKYPEAYNNRGKAKMFLRDYHNTKMNQMVIKDSDYDKKDIIEINEVIQDYTAAIRIDPENAEAYYYRGKAKYELNMLNEACLDWSKAGELGYRDVYEMIRKHTVIKK
jgi:tetratricopeptide (TPR) repeat protein